MSLHFSLVWKCRKTVLMPPQGEDFLPLRYVSWPTFLHSIRFFQSCIPNEYVNSDNFF